MKAHLVDVEASCQICMHFCRTDCVTALVRGEIDLVAAGPLRPILEALIQRDIDIHLELGQLTFIDVLGIHLLVDATAAAQARGCDVILTGMSPEVVRMLELSGTRAFLSIVDDAGRGSADRRDRVSATASEIA